MFNRDRIALWLEARQNRILGIRPEATVLEGPGFLYRPNQLVVNTEDLPLVANQLREVGAEEQPELSRAFAEHGIPISVFFVTAVPIPTLVSRLRSVKDEGSPVPRLGPNHVLTGEPTYHGGAGGEPRPCPPLPLEPTDEEPGLTVGALDTGVPLDLAALHPDLAARITGDGNDVDTLYAGGDLLDHEGGHGTFVSGILMRCAPSVLIDPEKVLTPDGIGDDITVTLGLAEAKCRLVNASLGGYTQDDMPPPALEAYLARLDPESVIVAAAGNNAQGRPFWPAAFKHVIAVGAVDTRGGAVTPASFSNFGQWVDCCAAGVDIASTYVKGEWRLTQTDVIEVFDGWACWSGTSFAAPQVTAAIARRMHGTGLTPRQAAHHVLADATHHVPGLGVFIRSHVNLLCHDC